VKNSGALSFPSAKKYFKKRWHLLTFEIFSVTSYLSILVSPVLFWPAIFLNFLIPIFFALNLALTLVFLFGRKELLALSLVGVVTGLPFFISSLTFSKHKNGNKDFSTLSFNAKYFRAQNRYDAFSTALIKWVVDDDADIKCIQEYSTNEKWEELNVSKKITDKGFNGFVLKSKVKDRVHNPGLAIFVKNKFEILNSGVVWEDSLNSNGAIFADVRIRRDTVRVYNVHLASMGLNSADDFSKGNYLRRVVQIFSKLRDGSIKRSGQIALLMNHSGSCRYASIICGDFNEVPYSSNYRVLHRVFENAFERAGHGFGFSLNSPLFFLRIDHQFYSRRLRAVDYDVDRSMQISDHFPTRGQYATNQEEREKGKD
jgi:endonuclease/exonuclease/phosphatase family metal-dependent hydrolase